MRRPLVNLHEAALQSVSRDGPRYPDEMFLRRVKGCRAPYSSDTSDEPARGPNTSDCDRGFVILTMGNDLVMRSMVPLVRGVAGAGGAGRGAPTLTGLCE